MQLQRRFPNTFLFLFLLLFSDRVGSIDLLIEYGPITKEKDLYGLYAPESWEIVPADIEMQWNNMQLSSACAVLTKAGRETPMIAWANLLWSEVTADVSCVKLLSAEAKGKLLANRARKEGLSTELSKMCHKTERRVRELVTKRLEQDRLASDIVKGIERKTACARWTKK